MRGKNLLLNTGLLTATSMIMRLVGLVFQVYLSNKIGAAGIGTYFLILSVNMTAATFAISGIRFATTRLVSEELGLGNTDGAGKAVRSCLIYAIAFGSAATVLLYLASPFIGSVLIGDGRTILALRFMSVSMPFLSAGAVLSGYFTAVCRVLSSAAAQMFEQLVRMVVIIILFGFIPCDDIEKACGVLVIGGAAGEIMSFIFIYILYAVDKKHIKPMGRKPDKIVSRMFSIALPLAFSAYARTALTTLQSILVPKGFKKYGSSSEQAMASYGEIQGMVFPIITFPSALFMSLAEMIVPELTEAQMKNRGEYISKFTGRVLKYCMIFSMAVMGIFFFYADSLGKGIYGSENVGKYIRAFAALMPIMYLDTITDGMLRGLGQHMYSMRYNVVDSVLSLVLVYVLLPNYAVDGYIFILYFSEIFNFSLSFRRLRKVTNVKLKITDIFKSTVSILGAGNITALLSKSGAVCGTGSYIGLMLNIFICLIVYLILLILLGAINGDDKISIENYFKVKSKSRKIFKMGIQ